MMSAEFVVGFFLLAYVGPQIVLSAKVKCQNRSRTFWPSSSNQDPVTPHSDNSTPKSALPGPAEAPRKEPPLRRSLAGSGFSDPLYEGHDGETLPLRLLGERINRLALHKLETLGTLFN